jgi:hypothetical protein
MRLHSTVSSFLEREVTLLAIVESCLATGVTLWVARHGHWQYLGLAAVITPFLMLRTPESTRRGLRWFNGAVDWFDAKLPAPVSGVRTGLYVMALAVFMVLYSLVVKIGSTLFAVVTKPLDSFTSISGNWFGQVLCIDSCHPPELVPGMESDEDSDLKFSNFSVEFRWDRGFIDVLKPYFGLILAIPFLLALIYRLSLKATAIVWLPLLWIFPKLQPKESVTTRLRLIQQSSWGRFVAIVSFIVLIAFAAKLMLYNEAVLLSQGLFTGDIGKLAQHYIAPAELPVWQVASTVNSLLALALFFWSDTQLIRLTDAACAAEARSADVLLRAASVTRATLSLYTSACLLYLAVLRAGVFNWPPLGEKLFPWG